MSIFDEKNKVKSNYFAFKNIGDKIEGTLVGKRVTNNTLKPGTEQNVYELKKEDNTYIDVYGKPGIDMQMKHIKLGQIIGFEFVKAIPPKQPGFNATHVIQIYADPALIDEKWMMEKEEEESLSENGRENVANLDAEPVAEAAAPTEVATPAAPAAPAAPIAADDFLNEINNFAMTKLGAKNAEEVKQIVTEKTNLPFFEANLPAIWEKLQGLAV